MDREQTELQFLGFFGIYRESFKLISSFKNIFTQITLALILPLTFIFLAQIKISDLLFDKILDDISTSLDDYTNDAVNRRLPSEWAFFLLFKAAYLIFLLILSLLCTSGVVYTIACIYTAKPITFKKVMGVVPNVWKRLVLTFLWNFIINVVYNFVMAILIILVVMIMRPIAVMWIFLVSSIIFYFIGFVYINMIWQLASVVTVLEDIYGIKAMKKSTKLIKGQVFVVSCIFLIMQLSLLGLETVFKVFVVHGGEKKVGMISRVILAGGCFLLVLVVILLGLVMQTVVYFVCKSYHHEAIDKPSLADHLESYRGDYVPLKEGGEVQLQVSNV